MRGRLWGLSGGLALLLSGCYSYPYYGQPYGGAGSMYGTPYQQYPGGSYPVPNGTYIPQNMNGASPTPASPGTGNGINAAPTFKPDGGGAAYPNNSEKPVPKPDDANFGPDPGNMGNRSPQDDGFKTPFGPGGALPGRSPTVAAGPLPGNPEAQPMQVEQVRGEVTDGAQYGYDPANYTWLQGVLSYDDIDKAWSILYSLTPSAQDRFGGDLTLVDDSRLAGVKNDTPVQLKGFLDQQMRDERGKPMYRITEIQPLRR